MHACLNMNPLRGWRHLVQVHRCMPARRQCCAKLDVFRGGPAAVVWCAWSSSARFSVNAQTLCCHAVLPRRCAWTSCLLLACWQAEQLACSCSGCMCALSVPHYYRSEGSFVRVSMSLGQAIGGSGSGSKCRDRHACRGSLQVAQAARSLPAHAAYEALLWCSVRIQEGCCIPLPGAVPA